MPCAIVSNYALDCKDTVGGIKNLYITELANVSAYVENASGIVSAITKATGSKFYKYELEPRGANNTSVAIQSDPAIGTVAYEQTITANFLKMQQLTSAKLALLIQNRCVIVVEMKSGQCFIFGKENGMQVSGGTATSGANMNEFNGYTLTFMGQEKAFAQEALASILPTITA